MRAINQAVTCPWCRTYYPVRPDAPNCVNCGGPFPKSPGTDRGTPPPDPPRVLPGIFKQKVMLWRNTHAFIGLIFMIVGIPLILAFGFGLIFAGVGYFLFRYGRKVGREKIQALTLGVSTEGEIVDIARDTTQSINGQNPFVITYTFTSRDGNDQADKIVCWDDNNIFRSHGDEIWVVYIPENPTISSPWPPMI